MPASTLDPQITIPGPGDGARPTDPLTGAAVTASGPPATADPVPVADPVAAAVHAAVTAMSTCDLSRCDVAQLDRLGNAAQRVRGFLVSFDTRLAARRHQLALEPFDSADPPGSGTGAGPNGPDGSGPGSGGADPGGSGGGPDPTLEFGGPTAPRPDADRDRDRARAITLAMFPQFARSLELGEVDAAHVDALRAALGRFDLRNPDEADAHREFVAHEPMLIRHARSESPRNFRRRCLDLSRRLAKDHGLRLAERQRKAAELSSWVDRTTGMGHISAKLEPELFEKVMTAIELQLASLKKLPGSADIGNRRLRVEAFAELICSSGLLSARSAEIIVLCDEATLRTGVVEAGSVSETIDGTPLHPETLRRLACDARLIPAVLGGDGMPLDLGRARYEPTSSQRRALAAMYRTCAHPECDVVFRRCRIHHVIFWEALGCTDLGNLLPLCERHHHMVHEGGWRLTMSPDRVITLLSPSGVITFTGDTRDRSRLADPDLPERIAPSGRSGPHAASAPVHRATVHGAPGDGPGPGRTRDGDGDGEHGEGAGGPEPITKRRRRRTGPAQTGDPTLFHDDRQAAAP